MRTCITRLGLVGICGAVALAVGTLWPKSSTAQEPEVPHFHHVHLNVTNPQNSMRFYQRIFGAVPIKFMGKVDALFTERSFLLMTKVDTPPPALIESGIWHMGWGGVDMPNHYEWLKKQEGVKIHTELYPLGGGFVSYVDGPDGERIEVNTQQHHRFYHIHMLGTDPNKTAHWYADNLNIPLRGRDTEKPDLTKARSWSRSFNCDNVSFIVYNQPDYTPAPAWWDQEPLKEFKSSKGRPIDHFAFSFRKIEPVLARMKANGVQILDPIKVREEDGGFRSFFVQAPNGVVVEVVESKPIPEGIWE